MWQPASNGQPVDKTHPAAWQTSNCLNSIAHQTRVQSRTRECRWKKEEKSGSFYENSD